MFDWTPTKIGSLSKKYKAGLKSNIPLHYLLDALVQLGRTGLGRYPNYQVTLPNNVVLTYNGRTHRPMPHAKFNSANITAPIAATAIIF